MVISIAFGDKLRYEKDADGREIVLVGAVENCCGNCANLSGEVQSKTYYRCKYYPHKSMIQKTQACKMFVDGDKK